MYGTRRALSFPFSFYLIITRTGTLEHTHTHIRTYIYSCSYIQRDYLTTVSEGRSEENRATTKEKCGQSGYVGPRETKCLRTNRRRFRRGKSTNGPHFPSFDPNASPGWKSFRTRGLSIPIQRILDTPRMADRPRGKEGRRRRRNIRSFSSPSTRGIAPTISRFEIRPFGDY